MKDSRRGIENLLPSILAARLAYKTNANMHAKREGKEQMRSNGIESIQIGIAPTTNIPSLSEN